jgi:hypothetical protein
MLNKHLATLILLLLTAVCSVNADEPEPDDATKMHGVWIAEKVTSAGQEVPAAKFPFELHFDDSKLIFKFFGKTTGKDRIKNPINDGHYSRDSRQRCNSAWHL